MISKTIEKQIAGAYAKAHDAYGSTWTIRGESFEAVRSRHSKDEFIEGLEGDIINDSHTLTLSALRSTFPAALMNANRTTIIQQGEYISNIDDDLNYKIDSVTDDTESPYIRLFLTEA